LIEQAKREQRLIEIYRRSESPLVSHKRAMRQVERIEAERAARAKAGRDEEM
jgi:hypothetical protein